MHFQSYNVIVLALLFVSFSERALGVPVPSGFEVADPELEARGIFGAIARVGMQAAKFAGKAATGGSFPSAKDNVNVARLPSIAMREFDDSSDLEARGIFGAIARVGMQAAKFAGKAATGGSFPSAKDNVNVARLPSIAMREFDVSSDLEARGIFGAIARVGMQAAKFAGKAATGGSFPSAKDNVNVARLPSIAMRELSYEFDELD